MKTYLLALIGTTLFLLSAKADTLWIERFDMLDGPIDDRGGEDTTWYSPWSTQNDFPDYRVEHSNPLSYPGADIVGGYLVGGDDFVATARYFNAYAFDGHYQDENYRIGIDGAVVYLSFLIRKHNFDDAPVEIILGDSETEPYVFPPRLVSVGYPGVDGNQADGQHWCLDVLGLSSPILTDSIIRYNDTYLMVLEISFGASSSTVNLWINPAIEDLSDLEEPTVTTSTEENIGFWSFIFNASYGGTNHGAIDEIVFHDPTFSPLPVELISFKGISYNHNHELTWITASEKNNLGFEIQTSTDGIEYHKIGWVDGHANSKTKIDYGFKITQPEGQYYRLKQIDIDGQFDFSSTVYIDSNPLSQAGNISPNPYIKGEKIHIPDAGYTSAIIYDLQGRSWKVESTTNLADELDLKLTELRTGLYTIQLLSPDGRTFKSKLLIKD